MGGNGFGAGEVFDEVVVFLGHYHFELVEFGLGQAFDLGLAELAEHQIHFTDAAMPAAEQDAPAARIEVGTAFH